MANYVNALEAMQNQRKYGNVSIIPVDYHPERKRINLIGEIIRYEPCIAVTEEFHNWYMVVFKESLYFVSNHHSDFKLELVAEGSEKWIQMAIKCQSDYASIYENSKLETKGVALSEEFLNAMPRFLQESAHDCWMTDTEEWCGRLGLTYVSGIFQVGVPKYDFIINDSSSYRAKNPFLPIVMARKDTMIDLDREFDRPFKIATPEMLEK